ncbi:ABSCISIC ACID-INSENSITIVE 5-like protein 2 [Capsicum annuum]|uniref:ABSCISIC ACID-INSENSITIVE 5-like protein 2 n=1 Tax=Capsicum annuum TaxID=4072 RepID=A0A1U8FFG2_CAPAN|nr:ABSCISIC ACID-INSENSITIVE 5-like protein 2 [Capsicum annuum]KAF3616232.1 ABSCISIC ACID-INSENSITIVE 5-like protein 2 [Capsicum annuum]PHT71268.1 ABSCISIC ACID-INSENSITIVE 5-like protein 2 [Capsicum annuum]
MGSQGGGGVNSVGATQAQDPKMNALARQGSLYSLTLDEVQNQLGDLGKPLSSMNLDELLKTVWTAEASQGMEGTDYGALQHGQVASGSSLHRQSSITLTSDLSKKTVDQVWQDIQQGHKRDNIDRKAQERKPTLGEITLEDFLVKAGVVAESNPGKKSLGSVLGVDSMALPQQSVQQQAQWSQYQIQAMHQIPPQQQPQQQNMLPVFMPSHPVQQPLTIVPNPTIDAAYPESQMTMSPTELLGTLSDTQTLGRKRVAPEDVVEKTVERRQKRMIKNRESAARSRARKQAYTHELENKVSRLEEENERLKRQKEIEKVLPSVPPPEPKYQLRRTSSAPF